MKNLPYFKGGTRQKQEYHLSFKGSLKELEFDNYEDFCKRADEILYTYTKYKVDRHSYKKYIYSRKLSDEPTMDNALKDKCFEWIISNEYEKIDKNDLYSLLGMIKKGIFKWNMNL